jgi:polysaccharide deacetylase 2 family uncharacterized protein YibQ
VIAVPDDALLEQAARVALQAEIAYARKARQAVWIAPAHDQVVRLIAAAWPVLATGQLPEAEKAGGDDE